jgi:hypothetical protein
MGMSLYLVRLSGAATLGMSNEPNDTDAPERTRLTITSPAASAAGTIKAAVESGVMVLVLDSALVPSVHPADPAVDPAVGPTWGGPLDPSGPLQSSSTKTTSR